MRRISRRPQSLGVKAKFWLTLGPRTLFGDGKADLLEAVDSLGSLRSAADSMSMSYRHAWGLLRELEQAWNGVLLVLPSPEKPPAEVEDYAARLIRKAIGYHVRLNV